MKYQCRAKLQKLPNSQKLLQEGKVVEFLIHKVFDQYARF